MITRLFTTRGLLCLYAAAIVVSAVLFGRFENKAIGDGLWWASVTAMTIGYGDIYPATAGGRIVAAVLMHLVPLLIIPLITARMASRLIVDSDAFTHGEQEEIKQLLRDLQRQVTDLAERTPAGGGAHATLVPHGDGSKQGRDTDGGLP